MGWRGSADRSLNVEAGLLAWLRRCLFKRGRQLLAGSWAGGATAWGVYGLLGGRVKQAKQNVSCKAQTKEHQA